RLNNLNHKKHPLPHNRWHHFHNNQHPSLPHIVPPPLKRAEVPRPGKPRHKSPWPIRTPEKSKGLCLKTNKEVERMKRVIFFSYFVFFHEHNNKIQPKGKWIVA